MGAACAGVVPEPVPRVDDPEAGRVDVGLEEAVGHPGEDGEVVLQSVIDLNTVLQEERQALDAVDDVMLDYHVGHVVQRDGAVVGVVDSVAPHVAGVHVARQVEVDRVAADSEGLASVLKLNILDPSLDQALK